MYDAPKEFREHYRGIGRGPYPALRHSGDAGRTLARWENHVTRWHLGIADDPRIWLLDVLTNERTLFCARQDIAAKAANDPVLRELDVRECWRLCRVLRDQLRTGRYERWPADTIRIPKGAGRGYGRSPSRRSKTGSWGGPSPG